MQMQPAWLFISTVWEASYVAINNRLSYHRSGHPFHSLAVVVFVMLLETFCVCSPKKKTPFFFFFPFAQKLEEISYLLNKPGVIRSQKYIYINVGSREFLHSLIESLDL